MKVLDLQTNREVDLPEHEVAQRYLEGTIRTPEGAAIPVVSRMGEVGTIAPENLSGALEAGYSVTSQDVLRRAELKAEYDTVGQEILTGAEGLGRGLTFGLYDAVAHGIDPEYAQEAQLRREINPYASIGGEVAGAVLPALLTGGSSTAASGGGMAARAGSLALRGAKAATTLPRAGAAFGRAAGRGVEALVGTEARTLAGRTLQRGVAGAAGGMAESLPYAVGHGISESQLHPEKTSEQILAGVGLETLMGGLAGGVLGGGAKLGSEAYERIGRAVFGDGAHPRLGEAIVKLAAATSGDDAAAIRRLTLGDAGEGLFSESAKRNRQLGFFDGGEVRDRVARDLTESLDDARAALSEIQDSYRGLSKIDAVEQMLPKGNRQAQIDANRRYLKTVDEALEAMSRDKGSVFKSQILDLREVVRTQRGRLEASMNKSGSTAAGPEATGYAALDEVKRRMQGAIEAATATIQRSPKVKVQAYGRPTIEHLEGLQESIRQHLMDETLFGAAAKAQREINDPWMRMIAANKNLSQRAKLFQGYKAGEVGEYGNQWRADPDRITRYLDGIVDPRKDLVHQDLSQWLEQGDLFAKAVGKYGAKGQYADEGLGAAVKKYQDAVKRVRSGLAEVEDAVVLQNQARSLSREGLFEGSDLGLGAGLSIVADSVVPFAVSGAVGTAKGVANAISAPGRTIRQLASIERLASGVSTKLDGGVSRYIKSVKNAAKEGAYVSKKAAVRGAGIASRDTKADNKKAYERTKDRIEAAKADPEGRAERLARSTRNIANEAPEVVAAVHAKAAKADEFLESKLPVPPEASSPWRKTTVPDAELAKFARYVRAAEDPVGTLTRELEDGTLSRETIETLDALYPHLAADIRERVIEGIGSMTKPPPYPERVRLSILLGTPLDDSLTPAKVATLQKSYETPEPPKPRPKGGSALTEISKSFQTRLNNLSV